MGAALIVVVAALLTWNEVTTVPTPTVPPAPSPSPQEHVLLAAGDIAECGGRADETAALLTDPDAVVAPLGDLAYPDGTPEQFADCYDPAWGSVRDRTQPTPGNHEYWTPGAAGYFGYFGETAGDPDEGWYSYELGPWHVVVLNSNCEHIGGCGLDSAQAAWLREDLASTDTGNILAYAHHPRFSVGRHGDTPELAPLWEILAEAGADVMLAAHDHTYQRFAPLDASGSPDPDGIRQFVVGTGGAGLYEFTADHPAVEFRQNDELGVLRLTLDWCGYRWAFMPVDGDAPLDRGETTGTC